MAIKEIKERQVEVPTGKGGRFYFATVRGGRVTEISTVDKGNPPGDLDCVSLHAYIQFCNEVIKAIEESR